MNNEFIGIIDHIGSLENLTSKNGRPFSRRTVSLHTVEQYPQSAVFTLSSELAQSFSGQVGQQAKVHFSFHTFESKPKESDGNPSAEPIRFNKLDAWRIDL